MRCSLFAAVPTLMKRITTDRSAATSSRSRAPKTRATTKEKRVTSNNFVKSEIKIKNEKDNSPERSPNHHANATTQHETIEQKTNECDLTRFRFAREKKPTLASVSPKKREHIKIEYDDMSPAKMKNEDVELENGKPLHWEAVLDNLREMRKNRDAPVDLMGCHKCPDETESPQIRRYQALVSLMLSSQTKDQVTHAAMTRLKEHGCSVDNILKTSDERLGELIYPVGFWKSKVKYIKKTTEILKNEYGGDIPNTIDDLCKLAGVGPKMAHLCMQTAWGEVTGIGVDTHVHRICNRLGWVKSKTPEGTRKGLEKWLPRELWSEVNHLLVGFGQQICMPVKPQCGTCLNREICPFGAKNRKGTTNK